MQSSPLSNFIIFSQFHKKTPYPWAKTPYFLLHKSLATTKLFSASVDLPVLDISYKWIIQYVTFFDWLFSFSMFSRFTHVVTCISISYLLLPNIILLYGYSTFNLLICQLMDMWVVCTVWMVWITLLWKSLHMFCMNVCFHFSYVLRSGIAGWYANSVFKV